MLQRARAAARQSFVIADVETTGFSQSDAIISIGAIPVEANGRVSDELELFFRIRGRLPPEISSSPGSPMRFWHARE